MSSPVTSVVGSCVVTSFESLAVGSPVSDPLVIGPPLDSPGSPVSPGFCVIAVIAVAAVSSGVSKPE